MVNAAPNCVKLGGQVRAFDSFRDESVHCLSFTQRAGFESTRIVENELAVAFKYEFVIDVVQSTL